MWDKVHKERFSRKNPNYLHKRLYQLSHTNIKGRFTAVRKTHLLKEE